MKSTTFLLCFLALAVTLVAAWSPLDQEIFRLKAELEASEGPQVSFYDFMGVSLKASQDDLNKAWKKASRTMHPDKVKQTLKKKNKDGKKPTKAAIAAAAQAASDRYARLGLVNKVLMGPGRERYDHFLANGFPAWKGTGYYYARFRPGMGSVLIGLFVFIGGFGHYVTLYLTWKRQQDFLARYINFARRQAWGDNMQIPGLEAAIAEPPAPVEGEDEGPRQPMNRRERRMEEKYAKSGKTENKKVPKAKVTPVSSNPGTPTAISGPKKKVVAENGKVLVVDSVGNVYLEERTEEGVQEFLLDPNEVQRPTIKDTALVRLPKFVFEKTAGGFLGYKKEAESNNGELEELIDQEILKEDYDIIPEQKKAPAKAKARKNGRK